MSVNFKEAFTYFLRDKSWKLKFVVLAIVFSIPNLAIVLWKNFIIGIPFTLFLVGFSVLLMHNLINDINPVLPDLSIKNIYKTGLKFYGTIFGYFVLYIIAIIIWAIAQIIIILATTFAGKIYLSSSGLIKQLLNFEMIAGFIVLAIFLAFSIFIDPFIRLLFCENLSFKESFNIKKIFIAFAKNWRTYLLVFGVSVFAYAPSGLMYNMAFIYDNKPILIFVLLISAFITSFLSFSIISLMTQAYRQSLAKINRDDLKMESLKHTLNAFDYKAISIILIMSVSLMVIFFSFPLSKHSPLSQAFNHTKSLKNKKQVYKYSYGYMDKTGKVIIKPQYSYGSHFVNGVAAVCLSDKCGLINKQGKYIIKPEFDDYNDLPFYTSSGNLIFLMKNNESFIFNNKGQLLNKIRNFRELKPFSEGLAAIKINNKWGYIDKSGKIVIKPQFDEVFNFREGIAAILAYEKATLAHDKTAFKSNIPSFGNMKELPRIPDAYNLSSKTNKLGFIDKKGNIIIEPQFDASTVMLVTGHLITNDESFRYFFNEGLASVGINGKYGYIDKSGNFVIKPQYNMTEPFINGIAAVKIGDKWGFINKSGETIVKPSLQDIFACDNDNYLVFRQNNKVGYINKNGKVAIPPQYDYAGCFSEGLAQVLVGDKVGYIDKSGKFKIKPMFKVKTTNPVSSPIVPDFSSYSSDTIKPYCPSDVYTFLGKYKNGLIRTRINDKYGFINKSGQCMLKPEYDSITSFNEGSAVIQKDNKWGYIDESGKVIFKPQFAQARPFTESLAKFGIENKGQQLIDNGWGNFIGPVDY